jgi:phosphonate transport system substrate-binding protein
LNLSPLRTIRLLPLVALAALVALACADSDNASPAPTLYIGGIPDQDVTTLERMFGLVAEYLSEKTGLSVRYQPTVNYAAIVTAFRRGDVHLAWFGGLTGVQARQALPGAEAIAQRPRDAEFHSVFIVRSDLDVDDLTDLRGLTFTFGSESSTSGHLMPRYFMLEAGIDPDKDLKGKPNFSGSHDRTYKLVEAGSFQAGALNEAVWEAAVAEGRVDTSKVRVFFRTPPYFDYNWSVRPDVDEVFGPGTRQKLLEALLGLDPNESEKARELLSLFQTDSFIPTTNENYEAIREVAERLGILR